MEEPATGPWVTDTSATVAIHLSVGLPVVPGGHKHVG